jgi:tetratricopeptide (TPR) repeat protein
MMLVALALAVSVSLPATPAAGSPQAASSAPPPADAAKKPQAYYDFLLGRHLEGDGEIDEAIAALKRAAAADQGSAEIRAELAGLYARQNRADEALAAGNEALVLDPENSEAHWVLGTVHAALVQGRQEAGGGAGDDIDKAVFHLEKARGSRRYDYGLVLTLGRLYLAKSDYAKAIEALSWLNERETGVTEAGYLLAQAYEGAGRPQDAIAALRATVESEPRFFRAWVLLGELLEKGGQFKEAASAYGQAARQGPRAGELRLRQASALLGADAAADARQVLEDYVKANPTDAMGLTLLTEAQRRAQDLDAAADTARRLIALEPKGVRGPYSLALLHEARRDYRKVVDVLAPIAASRDLDERVRTSRAFIGLLARLGYAYQELGEFDRAIATFEDARTLSPADGVADLYLAQAYIAAGRYDAAVDVARKGRALRPNDDRFARLEAQALREAGRVADAIAVLREEASRSTSDSAVLLALATTYADARQWEEAMKTLDEAEQKFPEDLDVPFQRGAVLEQQGKHDEAERAFRALLARDPLHAPALNYLGYMLADRGERLDEAIALIGRALEADPYNGSYLDSLGWAWFKKGDAARARDSLQKAADQLPRNSVVQDHLGDALMALGDRAGALAAWERALAGDLDEVDASAIKRKVDDAKRPR